jgi:hypothetical protein
MGCFGPEALGVQRVMVPVIELLDLSYRRLNAS